MNDWLNTQSRYKKIIRKYIIFNGVLIGRLLSDNLINLGIRSLPGSFSRFKYKVN